MTSPDKKTSRTPRWQVVENVVAALEKVRSQVPGMTVTQKAQLPRLGDPNDTRDIDVLVELPVGDRTIRIAVEVKNKRRRMSIEQMGCIADLRRDIATDRFCVVSTSGFTKAARKKAAENGIELATLQEFERSEFWAYPPATFVTTTGGAILQVEFDFAESVVAADGEAIQLALSGTPHDDIMLSDTTGTASVTSFLNALLQGQLRTQLDGLRDDDEFRLGVNLSERERLTVTARGQTFSGLHGLIATVRIKKTTQCVPERRFRLGDIELTTAELTLFGTPQQVSILRVPQSDGGSQLMLVRGPVSPEKVVK